MWGGGSGGGVGDEQVPMGVEGGSGDCLGNEQVLIYMGVGGSGGGLGETIALISLIFCSHRKFNLNIGCCHDNIITIIT